MKPEIKINTDNNHKGKLYRYLMERYEISMKNGYYLEAVMLDYAMIEDRLRAILCAMGLMECNYNLSLNPYTKRIIKKIEQYERELEKGINESDYFNNISKKYEVIENVLKHSLASCDEKDEYSKTIKLIVNEKKINIDEIKELFKKLKKWCKIRNELVHGLANKDMDVMIKYSKSVALEGKQYIRDLDNIKNKLGYKSLLINLMK